MSESVLITGGCGFIGSRLAESLHDSGYDTTILDNLIRGKRSNIAHLSDSDDVELMRGDIRTRDTVEDAMEGIDYVVHLAAVCLNRSIRYPQESFEVNLLGSNNVFQVAADLGVEKVLFASSASVYGNQDVPMSETDCPSPQTPYGISKLGCEYLLDFYSDNEGLDYVAYRFFNVYGAGQDTDAYYTSVINLFIERLLRGDPPLIHGSGEQSMDFVNVHDVVRALQLGIEKDVEDEVVNVGSGKSTSIADLAEILVGIVGADVTPKYEDRDVIVSHRQADTRHAKEVLGFETEVDIKDGLEEVVDYVDENME